MRKTKLVYLDNAANTPIDKEVVRAMSPYLKPGFCGNSHSQNACGATADLAVDQARSSIAKTFKVKKSEVFFTSGATESNNWVIKGLVLHELTLPKNQRKNHIICAKTEHASVLNACKFAEDVGFTVTYLPTKICGKISKQTLVNALRENSTLLVCCMAVNNETGVSNDVDALAKLSHRYGAKFLADLTQTLLGGAEGNRVGLDYPHVDYASFSAHKIYGPTGVGCLIARSDAPLHPLLSGGAQEGGLRGGTHNTAGIVGMAKAVEMIGSSDASQWFNKLFNYLIGKLQNEIPSAVLNAYPDHKNIVSISLVNATSMTSNIAGALSLYGICCSAGAACSSGEGEEVSHVLLSMGIPVAQAAATIRVSFSKFTTYSDIDALINALKNICKEFPKEENTANEEQN